MWLRARVSDLAFMTWRARLGKREGQEGEKSGSGSKEGRRVRCLETNSQKGGIMEVYV